MNDMNDDYLWDGSGEPDPDVERFEKVLGRYRSTAPAPEMPVTLAPRPRRTLLPMGIAAAVAAVGLGAALLVHVAGPYANRPSNSSISAVPVFLGEKDAGQAPTPAVSDPPPIANGGTGEFQPYRPSDRRHAGAPTAIAALTPDNLQPSTRRQSAVLTDLATSMHVEQIEVLFKSFRNATLADGVTGRDLTYDREKSRELLTDNALLRQAADRSGNYQAKALLDSVEPLLIDIATLDDSASADDLRSIQDRIQRKEVVTDLQLYAKASPERGL